MFQPLSDRVLVRRQEAAEKSPGGIIIPDNVKERPITGEVLAVGVPKIEDEISFECVAPGVVVMFGKYAGTEIEDGGEKLVVLRMEELLGIITHP